ncbi:MAG TPA: hypothetical protein VL283_01880 [Candidatus Baltobacteraceae bacterium]|nr:hypothetical protein [Candidatus Baltobacteraceae bacterium]
MRRALFLFATVLMLGAGCAQPAPEPVADDSPKSNPSNCERSGGKVDAEGYCVCPDGYMPDPADFCLDAKGVPGGEMKP